MNKAVFNYCIRKVDSSRLCFDRLYNHYYPLIVLHIESRYGDRHFAEDIAQEFFVKLLRGAFKGTVENPGAWVCRVCDNLAKDKAVTDEIPMTSGIVEYDEPMSERELFRDAVKGLGEPDDVSETILYMRIYQRFTLTEIADYLGLGVGTVRQKYRRAKNLLKKNSRSV